MNKKDIVEKMKKLDTVAGMNQLLKIMSNVNVAGRDIILKAISQEMTQNKKQQFLAMLRSEAVKADAQVKDWAIKSMTATYVAGMNQAQGMYSIAVKSGKATFPAGAIKGNITVQVLHSTPELAPHLAAVNSLISDVYLDFGKTMNGFVSGAEKIINDQLKRQIRSTIAQGRLEGASIDAIKSTIKEQFADKGFTVLLDKGGKQWELERYSEMVARTHVIKTNNEAVINRSSDFKVDIVEITGSIGATDEVCQREEGKIYSISGKSENYPALEGHEPPYHPNCRHTLLLRPDLK